MRVGARVRAKALEPGHGEAKAEASVGVGSAQKKSKLLLRDFLLFMLFMQ